VSVAKITVGDVHFGGPRLALIAGPCVIESADACLRHAQRLAAIARQAQIPLVYKSSFDKANRTSHNSYRGPGLDAGLRILEGVKE
jgi:2-dehydro-3-deoxyphosphooctonate aldolase (KDO 8-P synthase)